MKELFQEVAAFLWHVIDAPETASETREAAEKLIEKVIDQINGWPPYEPTTSDKSPQD